MTDWTEDFAQTDIADIDGLLGFSVETDGSGGGVARLMSTYLTPSVNDEALVITQQTTLPETLDQEIRVLFSSSAEQPLSSTREYHLTAGAYMPVATPGSMWGVGVRFHYLDDGARTLEIIQDNTGVGGILSGGVPSIMVTADVANLTIKRDVAGAGLTDLHVIQEIRFITTVVDGGFLNRAYLNEGDDDKPTLEWRDFHDPFDFVSDTFGAWYVAFGESQGQHLKITEIHGFDYVEKLEEVVQSKDRFSLKEIRDHVLARADGSSTGSDRAGDEPFMNELINSTVDEILDLLGDVALFMQVTDTFTFSADANGFVTLPIYVDRVLSIVDVALQQKVPWRWVGYTADEKCEIQFDKNFPLAGKNLRVKYHLKHHRMDQDADLCPIPRRFNEAVIYGVVMRIAEFDTNAVLHKQNKERFIEKVRQIKKAMNRQLSYSGERLNVGRRVRGVPWGKHLTTGRTTY